MGRQNKVSGVVLAGGLARRMRQQDKGLVPYRGRPMVDYALRALSEVAEQVLINANRNLERYRKFGYPVISDGNQRFEGPLAGIVAAMNAVDAAILLVMPCDSPLVQPRHLRHLLKALEEEGADAAVAFDGERLHPVLLALHTGLKANLETYLASGERKVERWLRQHRIVCVDFSGEPEIFANVNTLEDLTALQKQYEAEPTSR